jgi:D-alanine-D-alanine ligase
MDADPFPADDWPCDPRPFLPESSWDVVVLEKASSARRVSELVRNGYDLFFNLCDGAADQDVPGIEVVEALEAAGVPFTGATSTFYEPTREQMKEACRREGIATPAHVFARSESDVARAAETLTFPLFVKHYSSYASVDLSRVSRVRTPSGLRRQARKIMSRHGAALIEEFIEGTECTVLVAENPDDPLHPKTYRPLQYRFPDGESFKHAKMKWVDYDRLSSAPVDDPELEARLRDEAARFFVALDGASFGRCDIRVDRANRPFMLEINPNCGVYYPPTDPGSADLCLAHDPEGHEGFTRRLVAAAFRRHELRMAMRSGNRKENLDVGAAVGADPEVDAEVDAEVDLDLGLGGSRNRSVNGSRQRKRDGAVTRPVNGAVNGAANGAANGAVNGAANASVNGAVPGGHEDASASPTGGTPDRQS